jgi:YVTN family beta-propeller protein
VAVDPAASAVYVGNWEDGTVSVIDTTTGEVVGEVTVGWPFEPGGGRVGFLGLAVDPRNGDVYVADDQAGTVSVIERDSRQVVHTITGLDHPHGVAVDASTGEAYVSNVGDGTVSVIDTRTRQVVDTVEGGAGPGGGAGTLAEGGVAVDPLAGAVYVASLLDNAIVVIDTGTHKVIDTISGPPPGEVDGGVAVDPTTGYLYASTWDSNSGRGGVLVFGAR